MAVSLMFRITTVSTVMQHNIGPSLMHRHACVRAQTVCYSQHRIYPPVLVRSYQDITKYEMQFYCTSHNFLNQLRLSCFKYVWKEWFICRYTGKCVLLWLDTITVFINKNERSWDVLRPVPQLNQQFLVNIMIFPSSLRWKCRLSQHQTRKCLRA